MPGPTPPPASGADATSWPGATLLRAPGTGPAVTIAAMGAMVPEALTAADRLAAARARRRRRLRDQPRPALRRSGGARRAGAGGSTARVDHRPAFPARRAAPLVTVLDGHPHTLAFLAGVNGVRAAHLGVTRFGQSGDLDSVYRYHGLDADSIVTAALDVM